MHSSTIHDLPSYGDGLENGARSFAAGGGGSSCSTSMVRSQRVRLTNTIKVCWRPAGLTICVISTESVAYTEAYEKLPGHL